MSRSAKALGIAALAALALSAVSASAAGAETIEFRSEAQHTALVGGATSDQVLTAGGIELRCEEAVLAGTFEGKATEELALAPAYGDCTVIEEEAAVTAHVDQGGCFYSLGLSVATESGADFDGPVQLECEEPEEAIEVTATLFGGEYACMEIPPQALAGSAKYTLKGSGKAAEIAISLPLSSIDYVIEGICGETEAGNGSYAGGIDLVGENEAEQQVGIGIREPTEFNSESDETIVTAEALSSQVLETAAGLALECDELDFESASLGTSASQISAHPAYSECSFSAPEETGPFDAQVEANSCNLIFFPDGTAEGEGETAVECESEGDAIEVKVEFIPSFFSTCLEIPAQTPGDSTVDYANAGAGSTESIEVDSTIDDIEYTAVGACGEEETLNDATLTGEVRLTGEDEEEKRLGIAVGELTPTVHEGRFHSGSHETILRSEALTAQVFTNSAEEEFTCSSLDFEEATATTEHEVITAVPVYEECERFVPGVGTYNLEVIPQGCTFQFSDEEEFAIACPEGKSIELKAEVVPPFKSPCIEIPAQTPTNPSLSYTNQGEESEADLRVEWAVEGLTYKKVGVCGSVTSDAMAYEGEITITGEDVEEEPVFFSWEE